MNTSNPSENRLHALDAVRGFALLLGVAFHAALSFMPGWPPGIWAMNDNSPSQFLSDAAFVTHIFRMSLFFLSRATSDACCTRSSAPRVLGESRQAHCDTARRRLGRADPAHRLHLGDRHHQGVRRNDATHAGDAEGSRRLPVRPSVVPLPAVADLCGSDRGACPRRALDRDERLRGLVDKAVSGSMRAPIAVFTLGLPVAAALMSLSFWFYWTGIPTPDKSLIPEIPASVGYGTAFVFGWLGASLARCAVIDQPLARAPDAGVVATGWLLHTMHASPMAQPGLTKTLFAMIFGVAIWGWVLGLTGAALRFLSNYSATRRYIADASYWIY